tara:strand:+ start:5715 stop:5894 length:180 start_codon:yes stop_codon:yes gene_type:complete
MKGNKLDHIIKTEQIEETLKVLAEFPAKFTFGVIDMLRRLPAAEQNKDVTEEVTNNQPA